MMHTLTQTPRLPRLTQTKFLSILAVSVLVFSAPFLRADAGPDHGANNSLTGTWLSAPTPQFPPTLASFMSDGRVIFSRPVTVVTGPGTFALVSTGHGEWVRTGHNEFAFTMYLLAGETSVEFNILIKVAATAAAHEN